jgi:DNA-binding winged helix-turn-helix (wHTH) protein
MDMTASTRSNAEERSLWDRLRWFTAPTVLLFAMPGTLALLHLVSGSLSLTSNTLILLLLTVLYSLGSQIWVSVVLSLESSLFLNYFLTPPFHSFRMSNSDDVISLIFFLFSSVSVSLLVKSLTTKQEEIEVLLTRFEVLTGKVRPESPNLYALGDWLIDFDKRTIQSTADRTNKVHLTPIEWKVLELLVKAEGGLVSQEDLLKIVWGEKYGSETNYLRLYLSQLRKKLEASPKRPSLLLTEAGSGYRAISRRVQGTS